MNNPFAPVALILMVAWGILVALGTYIYFLTTLDQKERCYKPELLRIEYVFPGRKVGHEICKKMRWAFTAP